jgi:serine/threonine-protein kinase
LKRLGHYEIKSLLGKGGMGEVFCARDTKLGRDVALKVLPPELADDPERTARFRREARILASLTDAHIAALYGMEEDQGKQFLVMELVQGEDLAQRMARGPLPRDEALSIALQIARGLEVAHGRGIVHRDLKPANVMVGADGQVKILDFGLARAADVDPESEPDGHSPTITANFTRAGTILGTAAYMSPEQARGRAIDHRTDIWSFGVILFEMLSGDRLFHGPSISDTLAAVLKTDPEWDKLPDDLPPAIHRLLRRCLQRDRRDRLQAIGDARLEMNAEDEAPAVPASGSGRRALNFAVLAALAALAVGLVAGKFLLGPAGVEPEPARVVRSSITLPEGVQLDGSGTPVLALSPDASTLAFVGRENGEPHLFLRHMDSGEVVRVPDSYAAEGPFFSPDGQWVGFANGTVSGLGTDPPRLRKAPVSGGATQVVCHVEDYFGGMWRDDGTIIWSDMQGGGLWRVDEDGGTPVEIAPEVKGVSPFWPRLLPGGRNAIASDYALRPNGAVVRIDLETGEVTDLGLDGTTVWPLPTGHLLVGLDAEHELMLRRFDPESGTLLPGQASLLSGVSPTRNSGAAVAVSEEGTFVYATGPLLGSRRELTELVRLDFDGNITPLDLPPDFYSYVDMSPDGKRLVAQIDGYEVFVIDLARGTRLRLPRGEAFGQFRPRWVPDGTRVVWTGWGSAGTGGNMNLYVQPADGVSPPLRIEDRHGEFWASSWIPGTETLLDQGWFSAPVSVSVSSIVLDGSREPENLLRTPGIDMAAPDVRRDGRWIAYTSAESGENFAYISSFPDMARKIPVAPSLYVRWSVDGDRLILRSGDGSIRVVPVTDTADGLEVGGERELARIRNYRMMSVDPLGRGLIVVRQKEGTGTVTELQLVQGWFEEVRELLPVR